MKNKTKIILLSLSALALGACSSVHKTGEKDASNVSQESKHVAIAQDASYVTELSFDESSANLDSSSKKKLDEILSRAKSDGKIDEVKVISWSDREYPTEKRGKLSKAQNELAERRANNIKKYLMGADQSLDVDTYNMAQRPNAVSKLFNTDNAKIKKSLEAAGIAHDRSDNDYPTKAGKSTIMVILKE